MQVHPYYILKDSILTAFMQLNVYEIFFIGVRLTSNGLIAFKLGCHTRVREFGSYFVKFKIHQSCIYTMYTRICTAHKCIYVSNNIRMNKQLSEQTPNFLEVHNFIIRLLITTFIHSIHQQSLANFIVIILESSMIGIYT